MGVNIFFSKTSLGTTTDKDGFYTFKYIPEGRYELVISMIGYKMEKEDLILFNKDRIAMDFRLTPEPIQMKEINVTWKSDKVWLENYDLFKKTFLGTSVNGEACRILNEYVLTFDRKRGLLVATASRPLQIENNRLGYGIVYYLDEFKLDDVYVRYAGDSFFTEMEPQSEGQTKQWIKNRQIAYNGSLRHFLTTLGKRFELRYKMDGENLVERDDWLSISGRKGDPLIKEGFEVYLTKSHKSGITISDYRALLNDSLVSSAKNDSELLLSFNKKMKVYYKKESEEMNYALDNFSEPKHQQTSYILLGKDLVIIDKNGRYFETYMIEQQGYMGWERVGDQLPFDYVQPKD